MKTLYEWAGGETAFRRLMDAFYDRVEGDDLLSPFFPGGVSEEHRAHVTAWWCEVFGGPPSYTEELGGYENMALRQREDRTAEPVRETVRCRPRFTAGDVEIEDGTTEELVADGPADDPRVLAREELPEPLIHRLRPASRAPSRS